MAEETQVEGTQTPDENQSALLQWLESQGNTSFESEDAVMAALEQGQAAAQHASDLEVARRQNEQLIAHLATQTATKEPAPPVEPEAPKWSAPEVSATTTQLLQSGMLKQGAGGLYEADNPQFAPFAQEANKFLTWQQKASERLLRDPMEVLREAGLDQTLASTRDELKKEILAEISAERSQRKAQERLDDQMSEFFEKDSSGRPTDKLSARGEAFQAAERMAWDMGVEDRSKVTAFALDYASKVAAGKAVDSTATTEEVVTPATDSAASTKQELQKTFLEQAQRTQSTEPRLEERDAAIATAAAREVALQDNDEDLLWENSRKAAEQELV